MPCKYWHCREWHKEGLGSRDFLGPTPFEDVSLLYLLPNIDPAIYELVS